MKFSVQHGGGRQKTYMNIPVKDTGGSRDTHHVANISTAIQTADAQTILNAASARMLRVSFGVM